MWVLKDCKGEVDDGRGFWMLGLTNASGFATRDEQRGSWLVSHDRPWVERCMGKTFVGNDITVSRGFIICHV